MGASVTIDQKSMERVLKLAKAYKPDWPAIMTMVGVATVRWIDLNFRAEGKLGTPGGWEPLAPLTIALRRADWRKGKGKGYSGKPYPSSGPGSGKLVPQGNLGPGSYKILQDRGELKGSWSWKLGMGGLSCKVASRSVKAGTHQYGRKQFWPFLGRVVTIPARPMLPGKKMAGRILLHATVTMIRRDLKKAGHTTTLTGTTLNF